jgi:PPOX class probable F420-dependent enzyme
LTGPEARRRFVAARIARLATADAVGIPHVVPIVFAVDGDRMYSAVDAKPKRTWALRRLANIRVNPRVAVLVDHYADDWSTLWWARADGTARVVGPDSSDGEHAIALLTARYAQYATEPPTGPVVVIDVERWSGWSATPADDTVVQ